MNHRVRPLPSSSGTMPGVGKADRSPKSVASETTAGSDGLAAAGQRASGLAGSRAALSVLGATAHAGGAAFLLPNGSNAARRTAERPR